jgi:heat shock protein HtpX
MKAKAFVLLAGLTAFFLGVGFLMGGTGGLVIALMISVAMNIFSYWNSDKLVLRMFKAQEVDYETGGDYYDIVADLAKNAGIPMPRVYVIDQNQPNAFATGRNPENAAVAATIGLLNMLSKEEIAGVMAHELGHVRNRDTLTMTISATLAGAVSMLANFFMFFGGSSSNNDENGGGSLIGNLVLMFLAPMAASLIQMSISRANEFRADEAGAEICGHPEWLASALHKIEYAAQQVHNPVADRTPATAHMFIINPLSGQRLKSLFSTHPATQDRIARLENLRRSDPQRFAGVRVAAIEGGVRADYGAESRPTKARPTSPWSNTQKDHKGPWG